MRLAFVERDAVDVNRRVAAVPPAGEAADGKYVGHPTLAVGAHVQSWHLLDQAQGGVQDQVVDQLCPDDVGGERVVLLVEGLARDSNLFHQNRFLLAGHLGQGSSGQQQEKAQQPAGAQFHHVVFR